MSTIIKFEGNLNELINKLVAEEKMGELQVTKVIADDSDYYKLQAGSFDGNGVWFAQNTVNRFSLSDHAKGVMYMADSPHTACKEVFQTEKFIGQSDLTTHCMAEIKTSRQLRVFDETSLAPHLGIAVGDLMGPKAVYPFTQQLAKELSKHADGLEYLSRHTGKPCVVLWSDQTDGNGMVETVSVTTLAEYEFRGITAKKILKSQLNIRVL